MYDSLITAERQLAAGSGAALPTAHELALLREAVLAATAASGPEPESDVWEPATRLRGRWAPLALLGGVASVAACVLAIVIANPDRERPGLSPRGTGLSFAARPLCESGGVVRPLVTTSPPFEPGGLQACPASGTLKLVYLAPVGSHVDGLLELADGGRRWLEPSGVVVNAAKRLAPLPFEVHSAALGGAASARLLLFWTTEPLDRARAEVACATSCSREELARVLGAEVTEHRLAFSRADAQAQP